MGDPVAYFTLDEHVDDLGEDMFLSVYDDNGSGSVETVKKSRQVATTIRKAHAFVKSWMPDLGALPATNTDPDNMSDLIRLAGLEVAKCYAYQRRPEAARTYGCFPKGAMWEGAVAMLERIQAGIQRIAPDDKRPSTTEPNQGAPLAQDGPKAFVATDPRDNPSQGDW